MTSFIKEAYLSGFRHATIDEPYKVFVKILPGQLGHQRSRGGRGLRSFDCDSVTSRYGSRL
jgi:hypothetical protein